MRRTARSALARRLDHHVRLLDDEQLARPAVVLAPHPDDETLGCGGLIALKRCLGAQVSVVFMTDGASSHDGIDRAALTATRRAEASAACAILGVDADDLYFLEFPDGSLADVDAAAIDAVAAIVMDSAATQLVVPHPAEPPSDHHVTFDIATAASERLNQPIDALLYPVWMWDQWPWTNPLSAPRGRSSRRQIASIALRDRCGYRLTTQLNARADISTVLPLKRAALDAHASQMTRPADRPDWPTLSDVCEGEWLKLLLQPSEYFATARLGPRGDAS